MIEFLKHFFGFCGEHWHPNIFTILLGGLGLQQSYSYIKYKITNYVSNKD
tara:strand:+ start:1110 stop:1259 length:150 start_codon:yes stop_codon:yes gene_type:complete